MNNIVVIAHNIRSLHNVGSIFRTSDGAGVSKIFLTGYTGCPPRKEISKTAIGADEWIKWEHRKDPLPILKKLKKDGFQIIALEKNNTSIDIKDFKSDNKVCLILGNEIDGVNDDLLKYADAVVEIPMRGQKISLNVSVAFGIAIYSL